MGRRGTPPTSRWSVPLDTLAGSVERPDTCSVRSIRAGWGVRRYLLLVVLSSLLPLAAFAAYLSYDSSQAQLATIRASVISTTRALAVAVDEHVRVRRKMLEELAKSPKLQAGDLVGFHAEMVGVSRLLRGQILTLVRPDATRELFSDLPAGTEVPGHSDPDLVRRVFETGQSQLSDVFLGAISQEPIAVLAVPVKRDGKVIWSLQLGMQNHEFSQLLNEHLLPPGWLSGIVDRDGRFLARVPDNEKRVGQLASEGWRATIRVRPDESWDRFASLEGDAVYNGHARAPETGYIVGIGVPASIIEAPLRRSLWRLLIGGCVVVALGTLIAVLVARRVTGGLRNVAGAAGQVPMGRCDPPRSTGVREIDQIAAALVESARTILRRTDELHHLNETLEQRVASETAERLRAEAALRQAQKMEAIGQLTGGVAHDFNNLLQVISGSLENLRQRLATDPDARLRRSTELAVQATDRAASLTQRLLAFSRQQPLAPEVIDPNRLVGGMSDMIRRSLGEAVAMETVLAAGLWRVFVDPNQLESALLNLAVNARDAMPNGGKLTIETSNMHLDEAYALSQEVTPGQYVAICVTDTGDGMAPEVIDRVFDPFFTTKPPGEGSGLGLSQVYGFVKQSQGHVKVYSELGVGTTVKIYLPRSMVPDVAEIAPQHQPVPQGNPDTVVLVVEDDEAVRALSVDMLQRLGYRVLQAHDGTAALQWLAARPDICLLFTDIGLPGPYNGRQLADEAWRHNPALKVLFTTGYARNAIVHNGRLDPGVELIVKPFSYAALAAKLNAILEGK
jgi:signal transduction histidine kinase